MKRVSLVVVNYNNSECSIKMIESLKEDIDYLDEIVIVDNHSDVGDVSRLKAFLNDLAPALSKKVLLFESDKNVGYFPGLNLGLGILQVKFRVVVANNDIEFAKDFFKKIAEDTFSPEQFVICPDVKTIDGFHQNPHVINRFSRIKKLVFDIYYSNYYVGKSILAIKRLVSPKQGSYLEDKCKVHMGIGACYILTENFFKAYNMLEYPCFLYGEEAFLSNQVLRAEGITVYDPKYKLLHMESVATSKIPSRKKYNMTQHSYKMYKNYL